VNDRVRRLEHLIDRIAQRYAPDPRTAFFQVRFEYDGNVLRIVGATTDPSAVTALRREAAFLDGWTDVVDHVVRLPRVLAGESRHAIVSAAMVPLLAGPSVTETHVSQVVLGRRLTLLRRVGRWYHCRAEDGYLGWVHSGYIIPSSEAEVRTWEMGTGGETCISLGAELRASDGSMVALLPWGARFIREADGTARLPSGVRGELLGDLVPLSQRSVRFPCDPRAIVDTALTWIGAPYLWGGVTPAGVDCSGLVQAVFSIHGIDLPRDSDQQAHAGDHVRPDPGFSNLRPGGLLFFAERGDLISHVVMSMGGARIIHASLGNGGVARNVLTGDLPYERELRRIFVCARRYL
jgi:gamma-D-glutamyl-L-lysine dipeptidyl-peptidase